MSSHARPMNQPYTYWVLSCPHCEMRKALYANDRTLPDNLQCASCERSSASGAWAVVWEEFHWQDREATWHSRIISAKPGVRIQDVAPNSPEEA